MSSTHHPTNPSHMKPLTENHYKNLLEHRDKKISHLTEIKKDLSSKNKLLQQQMDEYKRKYEFEQQKNQSLDDQLDLLKNARMQMMERIQKTTADCKKMAQELVTLTELRDDWKQKAELHLKEKNELDLELTAIRRTSLLSQQKFTDERNGIEHERDSLLQQVQHLQQELKVERESKLHLEQQVRNAKNEAHHFQAQTKSMQQELDHMRGICENLTMQLTQLTEEKSTLSNQLNHVASDTSRLDEAKTMLTQHNKMLQQDLSNLREQCRSQEAELTCLRSDLGEMRQKVHHLETNYQSLEQKYEMTRTNLMQLEQCAARERESMLEMQSDHEMLKVNLQASQERMELIHSRLREKTQAFMDLVRERDTLQATIEDLQFLEEMNEMQKERMHWLEQEIQHLVESGYGAGGAKAGRAAAEVGAVPEQSNSQQKSLVSPEEAIAMAQYYESQLQQMQQREQSHLREIQELKRYSMMSRPSNISAHEDTSLVDITNTSQATEQLTGILKNKKVPLRGSFSTELRL